MSRSGLMSVFQLIFTFSIEKLLPNLAASSAQRAFCKCRHLKELAKQSFMLGLSGITCCRHALTITATDTDTDTRQWLRLQIQIQIQWLVANRYTHRLRVSLALRRLGLTSCRYELCWAGRSCAISHIYTYMYLDIYLYIYYILHLRILLVELHTRNACSIFI